MNTPLLIITFALCGAVLGEEIKKDDEIVKRQIQYEPQQYAQNGGQGAQQLPPEYLQLLQQLENQQQALGQPGVPQDPQQLLASGAPQIFRGQPPRRPAPRVTPEQEQQRRLQENVVTKTIREQEVRDQQNRDRAQVEQFYAAQGIDLRALQRQQMRQQQEAAAQQYQAELEARLQQNQQQQQQYAQSQPEYAQPQPQPQYAQPQYVQQQPQQYIQQQPQQYIQQQPQHAQDNAQRVSYSQVRFGSTKLEPRKIPHALQASYKEPEVAYYTQRQPQAQHQQVVYQELPQQYLIETTKPQEQIVSIPKQREQDYYNPQPQPAYSLSPQYEATTPASKSSIFVTTSRTPVLKPSYARQTLQEVRLPRVENKRPLSQGELNALINAGFQVNPTPDPIQEYEAQQQVKPNYYRGLGKRQNKLIPSPVRLTDAERQSLAKEGIRNLYRVVPAESQDAPPTYVLAIDPSTKRNF